MTQLTNRDACGMGNREIADFYKISFQTVKNHLTSILGKIGARARVNVTIWWWTNTVGDSAEPVYNPDYRATLAGESSKVYSAARRTLSTSDWLDLCNKYGNKCLCCGSLENLTRDHVVPISAGGSHSVSNIQPLCRRCNSKKGNQTIDYRLAKTTC